MKRGRLPLTALRSFESAGRHLSFSRAAEELYVSQAAISRQIRELETLVGQPLFERLHRRVALTDAGRELLDQLTHSFDAIDVKLSDIQARPKDGIVRVSTEPYFGGSWLMPRLHRFQTANPDIDVAVDVSPRLVEFHAHEADLAIRYSSTRNSWPRTQSLHLVPNTASPMLSPKLLANGLPLETPENLVAYTLLHEENRDGWALWLKAAGAESIASRRGPIFPDGSLATRAAVLGHGVALGDQFLNVEELKAGELVQPFSTVVPYGDYWLVAPDFERLSPSTQAFADWLMAEVEATKKAV